MKSVSEEYYYEKIPRDSVKQIYIVSWLIDLWGGRADMHPF